MAAPGATSTGKIAVNYIEKMIKTLESQISLVPMIDLNLPPSNDMQNANNVVWTDVQQQVRSFSGFDATGQKDGIIAEQCPSFFGEPQNVLVNQQVDQVRDQRYWDRNAVASGLRLASDLNTAISDEIINTGSIFFRTNAVSGLAAITQAQAIMNERQKPNEKRSLLINDADMSLYASELSGRGTVKGRVETDAWSKGQIGENVAGFDLYAASFLNTITGGAASTTTTAAVSAKPEGGTVVNNNIVTNIDYRDSGIIAVTATAGFSQYDSVGFSNGATPVYALGIDTKTNTIRQMSFKIVEIVNATQVRVWPKPIALDDAALTNLEKRYANINTQITSGATMDRLNTDTIARPNIFFEKNSIEVIGGQIPSHLLSEFKGMKVINKSLSNGLNLYFMYDADLTTLQVQFRAFIWYGVTNKDPGNNGSFVTYT